MSAIFVYKGCKIVKAGSDRFAVTYVGQLDGPAYFPSMIDALRAIDQIFGA